MERVHAVYCCALCDAIITDTIKLGTHYKNKHNYKQEQWICPKKCQKNFLTCPNMNRHLASEKHVKLETETCKINLCDHQVNNPYALKAHHAEKHEQWNEQLAKIHIIASEEQLGLFEKTWKDAFGTFVEN